VLSTDNTIITPLPEPLSGPVEGKL